MPTLTAAQNECSGWAASAPTPRAGEGVVQRQEPSADSRRARAAVGLQHVAVDDDLALAEKWSPRLAAIARWALDLHGAPALLALGGLRSARSGDDPGSIEYSAVTQPFPDPPHPPRHVVVDARRAQHLGRPNVTRREPSAISV